MKNASLSRGAAVLLISLAALGIAAAEDVVLPDHAFYDASGRHAGAYLCIPESSGGLRFDDENGKWISSGFDVGPHGAFIFQIKLNDDTWVGEMGVKYRAAAYKVTMNSPGSQETGYCLTKTPVNGSSERMHKMSTFIQDDQFSCTALDLVYTLNLKTLRYMAVDPRGYLDAYDEADSFSPSVTVGKCSKVQ